MVDKSTVTENIASDAAGAVDGPPRTLDFIRAIVADDLEQGRYSEIVTRFPPEPNGYLHVGHAKALVLNFGIAAETGGRCFLRFDDTNPETEDEHYVASIRDTVRWIGFDWGDDLYFASDYFGRMYRYAEHLIREGKAYVDSQTEEEIREGRGTVMEPGRESPYRGRSAEESLDLFHRMRAGEFPDGAHVLRARIDMAAPNMLLRDPILYRIRHATHYRTGDEWCVYPLYDYAHPIEDAIEGITHSLCTLEFENNRPLYDWVVDNLPRGTEPGLIAPDSRPRQYEFARGNLGYTVVSKRKLLELVRGGYVSGWDDPRMPTIAGLRRRGVTAAAIRSFWEGVGVTKAENRIDIARLEHAIRDDLNRSAPRVLAVLRPLRVVITNYPEGRTEELDAPYFPHDVPKEGSRALPFSRELYIEREDFAEDPPKGFHRLVPGGDVRLRYAYVIRCDEVVKGPDGEVAELRCSYYPETRGGSAPEGRTVKGTIQWVSAPHAHRCTVRLYDRLFTVPDPDAGEGDFKDHLNPESLVVIEDAVVEPSVLGDPPGSHYQFERIGYFYSDPVDGTAGAPVFNRTVTLRDSWARQAESPRQPAERKREARSAPTEPSTPARERSPAPPAAAPAPRDARLDESRRRYEAELGLPPEEAEILTRESAVSEIFEAALASGAAPKLVANWVIHELPREVPELSHTDLAFGGRELGELVKLVEAGDLSSSAAREVLSVMTREGGHPAAIVERLGLRQLSEPDALAPMVDAVLADNPAKVEEYRGGKAGLLGYFIGQVMRRSGGRANPELVRRLLEERLGG
jgi:glutaminyl-tRNA synthetase